MLPPTGALDGRQQRLELGQPWHVGGFPARGYRVALHRRHLDVAGVVVNRHQAVGAAGGQVQHLRIGVELHRLPDPGHHAHGRGLSRDRHGDLGLVEDADAADVAQRRHHAGIELHIALELAVVDGVPAAVEALHAARVAPLHDDGAHHAALREQHARAHLDDLVGGAAHQHVEAHLRDAGHVDVARRLEPPAAEAAQAVAGQVGLVQRHARLERGVHHRRDRFGRRDRHERRTAARSARWAGRWSAGRPAAGRARPGCRSAASAPA